VPGRERIDQGPAAVQMANFNHKNFIREFDSENVEDGIQLSASGLKWENMKGEKPMGRELQSGTAEGMRLVKALSEAPDQDAHTFKQEEWNKFAPQDLRMTDFIKVGPHYWRQAEVTDWKRERQVFLLRLLIL
jgi:hypothetical protein